MKTPRPLIPMLALLPLSLVGCDEIFTSSDAGDAGDGGSDASGGSDIGGGGTGTDVDDASDSSGATPDTDDNTDSSTDDDSGAALSSGQERLLELLADELAIYCAKSVECGKYDTEEECVEEYGEYFVTEALEGADLDAASDGCFRAVESYLSCYVEELECVEEYALSEASCGFARTQIGVACRNVLP